MKTSNSRKRILSRIKVVVVFRWCQDILSISESIKKIWDLSFIETHAFFWFAHRWQLILLTTRTQKEVDFTHRMQNSHQTRMNVVVLCSMNKAEKSTEKSKFFWSSDFETSDNNDDETASECYSLTSFEFSFAEEICSFWAFFFSLRFEIAISFDEMICRKSKTIAAIFASIIFSARKIFWIVFSTETLRKEISRSKVIKKMITKNEKKHRNDEKKNIYKNSKKRAKAKK